MEKAQTELGNKLKTLEFRVDKTGEVLTKRDRPTLERHLTSVTSLVQAVCVLKETIEEKKFAKGETPDAVTTWSNEIEARVARADEATTSIQQLLEEFERRDEETKAAQKHQSTLKYERELWEEKAEFEKKSNAEKSNNLANNPNVRLPKLSITPFSGKKADWLSFWGKFITEIDASNLNCLTKFTFLKEYLVEHVRTDIDGLPFSEEGYANAKAILEAEYGQTSEIVTTYVKNIMELPIVNNANPAKVKDFYKRLRYNVQSLDTLGRLADVKGNVRSTLDKLKGVKQDLVRGNEGWQEWDYKDLLNEIRKWTEINPVEECDLSKEKQHLTQFHSTSPRKPNSRSNLYKTQSTTSETHASDQCLYCDGKHKANECAVVIDVGERKRILSEKKRCFNCTGARHRAAECKSKASCQKCNRRHHTSICDSKFDTQGNPLLITTGTLSPQVIYPVVVVDVEGTKCRALLDTGAGSSYASAALLDRLPKRNVRRETKRIDMMLESTTRSLQMSRVKVSATEGTFSLDVDVTRVEKGELLYINNPKYQEVIAANAHLNGVEVNDVDMKESLPVHLILGASEYAKLKTETAPRVGQVGEPIAELTRFGWTIMSPGKENVDVSNMLLCQTSQADYDQLCRLDVLGLADKPQESNVYDEFKEQLVRDEEGRYETGLPWREDHPPLPNNKNGSLRRLSNLVKKLERQELTDAYSEVIEEQKEAGVVESVEMQPTGREFYLPHKPVVRTNAESTKLRVVYDASAKAYENAPSLNDCLYAGPSLQNELWNVLVRGRFYPVAVTGDIQKAFLQIRVKKADRDAMRFHWRTNEQTPIETLRFTRVLFGLTSSPFLLAGVVDTHLTTWEDREPELVSKLKKELYVDDIITGSTSVAGAEEVKVKATSIFQDAGFKLHKWHSNVPELESSVSESGDPTYAKQQIGLPTGERSQLGLPWNTRRDTLTVSVPNEKAVMTKRGVLTKLAKIYDPLGIISPITLAGKLIYRAVCDEKIAWDAPIPEALVQEWNKWERNLPGEVEIPRSLPVHQDEITSIDLHAFGDASADGVAACVYAVVGQPQGTNQGLVAARSRLSKRGLSIPRLELVAAHMAINLGTNVRAALGGFPVRDTYCWSDSTVALYWIKGQGNYKQFVTNRVRKINDHMGVAWRHVPTASNPADQASRGGARLGDDLWWNGPKWLSSPESWPADLTSKPSQESEVEGKMIRSVLSVAVEETSEVYDVLRRYRLPKAIRVVARMRRFVDNARKKENKNFGPLTTEETEAQRTFWVKQAQNDSSSEDRVALNLQPNSDGVLECRGRVQGEYPVYLPDKHLLARRVVEEAHLQTLHGGTSLTMAKVRSRYWIPRLRRLVKKVRRDCYGCKRLQALAYAAPPSADLPVSRTQGVNPYQVIGIDYAGPLRYRDGKKRVKKAYILLYACCLTRGIYIDLTPNLEASECLLSLKGFVARRGRPERIYSDNGRTFVAAANWIRKVMSDEQLQNYLADNQIRWQFNLSRAPWWGGHFERMIGLVKCALNKTIGNGMLSWKELQEVLLDVEVTLNNRPLSYVEDDVQLPVLTPNSMLLANSNILPEADPDGIEDNDLRKRARHLKRCKEAVWKRWTTEYLRSLREKHQHKVGKTQSPKVGDVVLIKSEDKKRSKWPIGIVDELIVGKDKVVRGARLRSGQSHIDRAIQHLYPLELSCDRQPRPDTNGMNVEARPFRPRRDAAVAADHRIREIGQLGEN